MCRSSDREPNSFAISFRAEGKIKHCRIRKEGRMYCIGDAEFDTMSSLVEYYQRKPLFRRMKLKYPVSLLGSLLESLLGSLLGLAGC